MESRTTQLPKDQLPQPRKLPVQARSKALVDAIAEACLRILDKEGEEALTVNRIAEISGATVGSIYQYFPNKESMTAAVYERLLDQESEQLFAMREQLRGLPLEALLRQVLANMLRVEQRLAHNVEVNILRDGTQLFGRHRKVVGTHGHQRPVVAGAEVAVEVAEVGDLHIGALDVHGRAPLSLSCRAGVPARTVLWQHCITSRGV